MASSLTRSSRTEGFTTRSKSHPVALARPPVIHNNNNAHNRQQPPNIGRKKRARQDDHHIPDDLVIKKARIAIEIIEGGVRKSGLAILSKEGDVPQHLAPQKVTQPPPQQTPPPSRSPQPSIPTKDSKTVREGSQPKDKGKAKTIHQKKVANGIQHELDRLQPRPADVNKDEKRKLRSQEGSRFKSELSAYFPEYDEVIGNEPKQSHILNLETPITIVDSGKHSKPLPSKTSSDYAIRQFSPSLYDSLYDAKRVDFSFLDQNYKEEVGVDPLSDEYLEQIHKKPERLEKTIRNSDKGRAQHEKDQVARLLDGLQGHDWLKLMGVSGVTETKKKDFESARAHFINGCEIILDKFKSWKDEEKRRRLEKEQALAEAEDEEDDEEAEEVEETAAEDEMESIEVDEVNGYESDGDPPDYSDIDAMVARQLQEEVKARSMHWTGPSPSKATEKYVPPPVEKEFVSFFSKPHLRAAALGKHRRSGRSVAAWGQPLPELPTEDFNLPEEYRDEETLKLHARAKRRAKRVVKSKT